MEIVSSNFQDSFFTVHRLNLCKQIDFDNFVIKAEFHRLWLIYTPQNNLRTTQCKFPLVVYLVRSVAQTRHIIEQRFSVPLKGVKNKAFPIKIKHLNFFAFSASQICNFSQIFKKSCFIILSDVRPLPRQ